MEGMDDVRDAILAGYLEGAGANVAGELTRADR